MKRVPTIFIALSVLLIVFSMVGCRLNRPKKTIENLVSALNEEATSAQKFTQYASVARNDRSDTLAVLFDAAAKIEALHLEVVKKALSNLGESVPNPVIGSYTVGTSVENLKSALDATTSQVQTVYQAMIKSAENDKCPIGAKAITWLRVSDLRILEYLHQFSNASTKGNSSALPMHWVICPTCGMIFIPQRVPETCNQCLTPAENFVGYQPVEE